jgi:3-deoxy-manno-octulosonate cytidylyltransferase (CMP-KDO synthetase)
MSSIKVVIPARYGSSRLEGKPLLQLLGKSIVLHVVERCKEAGIANEDIFVATDDKRILSALEPCGVQVVMTSDKHQSGTDRICEVANKMGWENDAVVLNVQGDEPMIPPKLISNVASFALAHCEYAITTAVVSILNMEEFINPNVVKAILADGGRALYFTRGAAPVNRDSPDDYSLAKRHIGIYGYRVAALKQFCSYKEDTLENCEKLEQLRALSHGMTIGALVYEGVVPHGIDTIDDYENIKLLMQRGIK